MRSLAFCCLPFAVAAGCSPGTPVTMTAPADMAVAPPDLEIPYPAPRPMMPTAQSSGGPVMAAPRFVAISFANDPLQSSIDDFVAKLAASSTYWSGTTAEYGVGPATALPPIHSSDVPTARLTDSAIRTWLNNQIQMTPGFPQPDANTIYALFYTDAVTVTFEGGASCQQFQGYHGDYQLSGKYVTYAVMARCPPPVSSVTVLDNLTATASHEFIEAATDPLAIDNPAWASVDDDHAAWMLLAGGEVGDLCAAFPDSFYRPADLPYLVQRTWSNARAAAGHDPCEPDGTEPYFNSAPVLKDTIPVSVFGDPDVPALGVHIPVGQSATVELDLYSDAPTSGPWTVSALDVGSAFMGGAPELSFSFDKTQGQNGDKIQMTITALKASQDPSGASLFWIESDLGQQSTVWLGLVGN